MTGADRSGKASSFEDPSQYWFARYSKSIILVVIVLAIAGIYEALSIPIAVFPATNFPRIIIGVDNGVMPRFLPLHNSKQIGSISPASRF